MPEYKVPEQIQNKLSTVRFGDMVRYARVELREFIKSQILGVSGDLLIISEELRLAEKSQHQIDLLAIDRGQNLVVIEILNEEVGKNADLRFINHAALVANWKFEQVVKTYSDNLFKSNQDGANAKLKLEAFLGSSKIINEKKFGNNVRIILISGDFPAEVLSSANWLNKFGLEVSCICITPSLYHEKLFVNVEQICLNDEKDYVQLKEKVNLTTVGAGKPSKNYDSTKYDLDLNGEQISNLSKNKAILHTLQYFLANGIDPKKFIERDYALWGNKKLLIMVNGEVNSEEFIRLTTIEHQKINRKFDPKRYYCRDNELVKLNGNTYAIYNQWTGEIFMRVMSQFKKEYSDLHFDFKPSNGKVISLSGKNVKFESEFEEKPSKILDYSKYDLNLGGEHILNLPKNRAILRTIRYLIGNDVDPVQIAKLDFGLRPSRILIGVSGEVDGDEFIQLAKIEQQKIGEWFDSKRYFCNDGELIVHGGRTYAVNSQWTGKLFQIAMSKFMTDYKHLNFDFTQSSFN